MKSESFREHNRGQSRLWNSAGIVWALGALHLIHGIGSAAPADPPSQVAWTFDRIDRIGGHPTTVLGHPRVIDTPLGKAVEFNGVDDGLVIGVHPLAGAETFTWEAIFRPDGGNAEQRWFHLEENPATGLDSNNRMLFEIRVIDGRWCLDAFNKSGAAQKALLNRNSLHALGAWFHVAAVYDGKEFRNYVDGVQNGAGEIHLAPRSSPRSILSCGRSRATDCAADRHCTARRHSPGQGRRLTARHACPPKPA